VSLFQSPYSEEIWEQSVDSNDADMGCLQFHKGNFRQPKFMTFDLMVDWAEQVVSQNIAQFQPNYGTCSPLLPNRRPQRPS
jgi:hypothetical protein